MGWLRFIKQYPRWDEYLRKIDRQSLIRKRVCDNSMLCIPLSDEQIRIINLNTDGRSYLYKQEEWYMDYLLKRERGDITENPVYEKMKNVLDFVSPQRGIPVDTSEIINGRVFGLMEKFQNRQMTKKEYGSLMDFTTEEFVDDVLQEHDLNDVLSNDLGTKNL